MLAPARKIPHEEVIGESKHACAYQGHLSEDYDAKLQAFVKALRTDIKPTPYGWNREAWFLGEPGTVGDYAFSKYTVMRHDYPSWIWEMGRHLYEQTGHPLEADQYLVAFIPHYFDGGSLGLHQDDEKEMRDDWIVSVSLGSPIRFQFGPTKTSTTTTLLDNLSVLGMSRMLWHGVPPVKGERWNITFRCWKSEPDYRRLTGSFDTETPRPLHKSTGAKKACAHCKECSTSTESYLEHLKEKHKVPTTKVNMLRYNLGECPSCGRFFSCSRGWAIHTQSCRGERAAMEVELPRKCWVWWGADKVFYEGVATKVESERPPSFLVKYADEPEVDRREFQQFVVFTDPELTTDSVTGDHKEGLEPSQPIQPCSTPTPPSALAVEIPNESSSSSPRVPLVSSQDKQVVDSQVDLEGSLEEGEVISQRSLYDLEDFKSPDSLLPDWFLQRSLTPVAVATTPTELTALIIELSRAAASLRRLPPLRLWRGNQRRAWARCTKQFTPYFSAALRTDASSEDFLKLCLRLLELPSIVLTPTLPAPKAASEAAASLSFKMKKAETLAFQDRLHEAAKVLFSHGITPPSEEVYQRLKDLHPKLKEDIPAIELNEEQFQISPERTKKLIFRHCSETWKSLDPFGWSTALLHLVRAFQPETGPSFFDLTACLISKLANCEVTESVAFIFNTGSLLALNKDSEEDRLQRMEEGLQPRERPINQGSMFLKLAFDLALRSKEAQECAESLLPIQQGLGSKRGMELIAHSCAAFHKEGYAILKLDASNGFQEIKRSEMHKAVERRCPSLLGLFQKYYGRNSIGLYNTGDTIKIISVEEGCKMGCRLASFGFDLTAHDAYLSVKEQLERTCIDKTDRSFVKTATDDVIIVMKADKTKPAALCSRVRAVYAKLEMEAQKVGLSFENDKSLLLMPHGWELPEESELPAGLDVRSDMCEDFDFQGIEVVGSPVGSEKFCKRFVSRTVRNMVKKQEDISQLHPQASTKILLNCIAAAPGYIAQVCHPNITKHALHCFDRDLWYLWMKILEGGAEDRLNECSDGFNRTRKWAYLPARLGGAGLRSWLSIADYAWFSSVAECSVLEDVDFDRGRRFIKGECKEAHALAMVALGGATYVNQADFELIPPEEPDVLYQSNYYKNWKADFKGAKLQKEIANFLAYKELKQLTSPAELKKEHVTKSEIIRSLSARQKPGESVLTQLFTANLSDHEARLTKTEFIISARQFLSLPALKTPRGELVELKCGCEAQKCPTASCAGTIMDPTGNHALLCHSGIATKKATLLERSLERVFRKAGGRADRQPPTYRLLGDVVPKEDIAVLFTGGLNQEETKQHAEIAVELIDAFMMKPSVTREAVIAEARSRLPELKEDAKAANHTLRFDLCLAASYPADAPREAWLDHAIVHETSESYQDHVIEELEAGEDVGRTYPFRRTQATKHRKYGALVATANHLSKQKLLDFQPFFLLPVISALGYLNEDAQKMTKWMSTVANKNMPLARDDGIPGGVIKNRYKVKVRNAICFGLLRGNALAMNSVGRPFVSRPI